MLSGYVYMLYHSHVAVISTCIKSDSSVLETVPLKDKGLI
jgi:hypothetical protein